MGQICICWQTTRMVFYRKITPILISVASEWEGQHIKTWSLGHYQSTDLWVAVIRAES